MVTTRSKLTTQQQQQEQQSQPTTERQKWAAIFKALKKLLIKQQSELQLAQLLHQSWESHLLLLQDQISQLRLQLESSKLTDLVVIANAKLLVGSNRRDAFVCKHKLDDARGEVDDFKAMLDILSHRRPDLEDISPDWLYEILRAKCGKDNSPKAVSAQYCKMLEKEVATLKRENEKLSLKNNSDMSSLKAEIKFAWNQYNEKEVHFTRQLQAKNDENNKANEQITTLLASLEQLQMSNSTLRANARKMEAEARQKDEMISRYSKELELLKCKRPIGIPTLKRCSAEASPSSSKRRRTSRNSDSPVLEEDSSSELESTTAALRDKLNELEVEVNLKNGEIASLSKELNLLRSKTVDNTPVRGVTRETSSSRLKSLRNGSSRGCVVPKVETSSAQHASEKAGKRSKRKQEDVIIIEDTPRLFTSQFKIPKLKNATPRTR